MLARIAHRGPDGEGVWDRQLGGWQVALGHRRLSIIDVAGGTQPMENGDGAVVITYNGEVYNFMRAARRARAQAATSSGRAATPRSSSITSSNTASPASPALDGMFAFAIWEARTRRLTLARDRAGIKPLYYAELADGGIVFASELHALLAHGGVDRELSIEGLASYFFSDYVHPPATIVRKVRKLPPGHTIIWQDGNFGAAPRLLADAGARARARQARRRAGGRAVVEPRPRRHVAAGVRRAGGHLPVGRHRFVVRRDRGRRGGRAHEGVLDRLRERRPSTNRNTRA